MNITKGVNEKFKLSLIKLVQENKCLYDKTDVYYYSKDNRDSAWGKIGEELGTTATECRNTWKALRELYYKKAKKEPRGAPTGDTLQEWPFYKPMAFLKTNIAFYSRTPNHSMDKFKKENEIEEVYLLESPERKRTRMQSITPVSEVESNTLNFEYLIDDEADGNEHSSEEPADSVRQDEYQEEFLEEHTSEPNLNHERCEFKKLCRQFNKTMYKLENTLAKLNSEASTNDEEDAVFLKNILTLMKSLPDDIKDEFQSNMYTQIFKLRAEVRKNKVISSE